MMETAKQTIQMLLLLLPFVAPVLNAITKLVHALRASRHPTVRRLAARKLPPPQKLPPDLAREHARNARGTTNEPT